MDIGKDILLVIITACLSILSSFLLMKKEINSKILTTNIQQWVDGIRNSLSDFLSFSDMTSGMALAYLNGDPILDRESARKLYNEYLSKMIRSQEKILLYLDDNNPIHKNLISTICSYVHFIHYSTGHNDFDSEEIKKYVGNIRRLGRDIIKPEWDLITQKSDH